jgi:2-oxoglutarate dehydrogenase E2 component (dihydrolipoamide succinyltransferase)
MSTEILVPTLPESVADATVLAWHKDAGASVRRGENLVDLETDKVVLEVPSPANGILAEIAARQGDVVSADAVLGRIEEGSGAVREESQDTRPSSEAPELAREAGQSISGAESPRAGQAHPAAAEKTGVPGRAVLAPAARRLVKEMALDPAEIVGTGRDGRIHKADVLAFLDRREPGEPTVDPETVVASPPASGLGGEPGRPEQRVPMTRLRARIAERLVQAQQSAAILTTVNEVNLQAITDLRGRYKEQFEKIHGARLGFMSFFVKAAVEALQRFPVINASVDDNDIIYHGYYDIGTAVSSERGLVVPILRNCDQLSMGEIEQAIGEFSRKAKDGSLSYDDLTGGTFSITNGGVFGSLLSTPILNPPQSAILGMHKIEERPIVERGVVVVRPMMYLALSYDHRLIDGRDAVRFLVTIKELLEDPARLLLRV